VVKLINRWNLETRIADAAWEAETLLCLSAQRQFDATGSSELLYRQAMHDLQAASSATEGARPRMLLDGPSGSGKSIAVAAQVARARAGGALVLYVPSAFALIQDAFFSRCGQGAASPKCHAGVIPHCKPDGGVCRCNAPFLGMRLTVAWVQNQA